MEGEDLFIFSALADQASEMVVILMSIASPFVDAISLSSDVMLTVTSLIALGWAVLVAGIDKGEGLKSTIIVVVLAKILIMPVPLDYMDTAGSHSRGTLESESTSNNKKDVPLITFLVWKGYALTGELFLSAIHSAKEYVDGTQQAGLGEC